MYSPKPVLFWVGNIWNHFPKSAWHLPIVIPLCNLKYIISLIVPSNHLIYIPDFSLQSLLCKQRSSIPFKIELKPLSSGVLLLVPNIQQSTMHWDCPSPLLRDRQEGILKVNFLFLILDIWLLTRVYRYGWTWSSVLEVVELAYRWLEDSSQNKFYPLLLLLMYSKAYKNFWKCCKFSEVC